MSLPASRQMLRQSMFTVRRAGIRNASSTSEAAGAAKEKAAEATSKASEATSKASSKASEGLSRVTSSASSAASKASSAAMNAVNSLSSAATNASSKATGRTGRLIQGVTGLIPRVVFYSRVALELGKLVAQQRGMAPPNMATVQKYLQPVTNVLKNPSSLLNAGARTVDPNSLQPANILNAARNVPTQQWVSLGVIGAEVLGFFCVGEMIGRFKLVGYRAKEQHH